MDKGTPCQPFMQRCIFFQIFGWDLSLKATIANGKINQTQKIPGEYFSLTSLGPKLQSIGLLRENLGALVF